MNISTNNDLNKSIIQPLVSILITAFNREFYIAEAIESALQSTYTHFEVIIVDDCSTDNTFKIASSFLKKDKRVKVFRNNHNLGQFGNRNKAIHLANGNYIKFLDSDDKIMPNGLEMMISGMLSYPNAGIGVQAKADRTHELPHELSPHESIKLHYDGENHLCYGPTGVIYTKEALCNVGLFEESYGILADTLLNLKIASKYSTVLFQRNLFYWRQHFDQITTEQEDNLRMINERNIILKAFMTYEYLPLNQEEKNRILRNFLKINTMHFIHYLVRGKLRNAMRIKEDTDLSLKNVLRTFLKI